jgi:deazaflavin-dependent oxidoreductase (nitroreductase family)
MPLPHALARANRWLANPILGRAAGRVGALALLEHRGRRSGRIRRTPVIAFQHGDLVTVALTYGSDVDWLANVRATGGCTVMLRRRQLVLGPPRTLDPATGSARMPPVVAQILRALRVSEFVEFPVLARRR